IGHTASGKAIDYGRADELLGVPEPQTAPFLAVRDPDDPTVQDVQSVAFDTGTTFVWPPYGAGVHTAVICDLLPGRLMTPTSLGEMPWTRFYGQGIRSVDLPSVAIEPSFKPN